ncbi:MAG: phosphatidylserine decarboxylase [Geothrix sp.]|uniref:phosphatidylserine decarboxylase n=1 Tax=Geothrix sp. TaxID=1962974 RepID=UPI00182F1BC5|nr:phosphatidylserine decarboxylase [Geothrix sp.]NWJ42033.1 phosphatidylserine decarboxylase [Geothrix sp.]WIL19999.1 MAG: phosphatidylserine decarboxylase [Geothrix sp.]
MSAETTLPYFDRHRKAMAEERVFEASAMAFLYGSALGRLLTELILKRRAFSRWYAWRWNRPASRRQIRPFIERYGIDAEEFESPVEAFMSFNDFFTRRLKPECRPIAPGKATLIAPADAKLLAHPCAQGRAYPVKGRAFSLAALTGHGLDTAAWEGGTLLVFRLSPADAHRFVYFDSGTHGPVHRVPGFFHSVSPISLAAGSDVFGGNEREWTVLETDHFGQVIQVEVAALTVNGIVQNHPAGTAFRRGEEKGHFAYGSTLVLVFQPGRLRLDEDILAHSATGLESGVRCGSALGSAGGTP